MAIKSPIIKDNGIQYEGGTFFYEILDDIYTNGFNAYSASGGYYMEDLTSGARSTDPTQPDVGDVIWRAPASTLSPQFTIQFNTNGRPDETHPRQRTGNIWDMIAFIIDETRAGSAITSIKDTLYVPEIMKLGRCPYDLFIAFDGLILENLRISQERTTWIDTAETNYQLTALDFLDNQRIHLTDFNPLNFFLPVSVQGGAVSEANSRIEIFNYLGTTLTFTGGRRTTVENLETLTTSAKYITIVSQGVISDKESSFTNYILVESN